MPDVTVLRQLLTEYKLALETQSFRVRDAHTQLTRDFARLKPVYDGVAATEFKTGWARTQAAFEAYVEGTPALLSLLTEKIQALDEFDRGDT